MIKVSKAKLSAFRGTFRQVIRVLLQRGWSAFITDLVIFQVHANLYPSLPLYSRIEREGFLPRIGRNREIE